jgi:hypothetical protein
MHLQRRVRRWIPGRRRRDANVINVSETLAPATEDAWEELFAALPRGWMVGRPPPDPSSATYRLYAFERRASKSDPPELAVHAATEGEAVRDLARLLRKNRRQRRA